MNIAALARRTEVAPDTIRKWEQRYDVLMPSRTAGGQRRYTELDVARVEWLKARLAEGYRIGEAAALLGAGVGSAPTSHGELRAALEAALLASDSTALAAAIDQTLALYPLEEALYEVIVPFLRWLGAGWESGELSVAQEHLASEIVRGHLESQLVYARGDVRGVAVLACAPSERHDLGLLMLAALMRGDGWQVAYLGAYTPLPDAFRLAHTIAARLLCISVTMPESAETFAQAIEQLETPNGTELVIGGAGTTPQLAKRIGARHLNGDLSATVARLRKLAR